MKTIIYGRRIRAGADQAARIGAHKVKRLLATGRGVLVRGRFVGTIIVKQDLN